MSWPVAAQVSGEFYLEKSAYKQGEPVFLYFRVTNNGPVALNIHSADPYSFCSGYRINITRDSQATSHCKLAEVFGSCFSSAAALLPGETRIERLLLNFDHEINATGDYSVNATRNLSYAGAEVSYFDPATAKEALEIRTLIDFHVSEDSTSDSSSELQFWVDQLHSKVPSTRVEAARTLASLAPPSLEDTLLYFAGSSEFRQFAPLAFHRLNTPRSMAAMAELLNTTEAGTFEHMKSANYLAESGDTRWYPLLLEVAKKNARIANYVDDAAELGGDQMLPVLSTLAKDPDKNFTAVNAVSAMGYTASRAAVPILLDFLRSPDPNISDRARYGLRLLTHRTATNEPDGSPQSEYARWSQWWTWEGGTAPIYRAEECLNLVPLN